MPACDAVIEQVPTATSVTVFPETVQIPMVVEAKLTASPELAVALMAYGAVPKGWFASAPNVMAWLPRVTLKLCETGAAAA